jgi:hypothetical protein
MSDDHLVRGMISTYLNVYLSNSARIQRLLPVGKHDGDE